MDHSPKSLNNFKQLLRRHNSEVFVTSRKSTSTANSPRKNILPSMDRHSPGKVSTKTLNNSEKNSESSSPIKMKKVAFLSTATPTIPKLTRMVSDNPCVGQYNPKLVKDIQTVRKGNPSRTKRSKVKRTHRTGSTEMLDLREIYSKVGKRVKGVDMAKQTAREKDNFDLELHERFINKPKFQLPKHLSEVNLYKSHFSRQKIDDLSEVKLTMYETVSKNFKVLQKIDQFLKAKVTN
mmetsp:Transcript_3330/g.5129  ORF Transcript_3330/g.5129 Transcript_3330/m.5129 type:complete len:236 (+) Transcript_3330:38-745(+)